MKIRKSDNEPGCKNSPAFFIVYPKVTIVKKMSEFKSALAIKESVEL